MGGQAAVTATIRAKRGEVYLRRASGAFFEFPEPKIAQMLPDRSKYIHLARRERRAVGGGQVAVRLFIEIIEIMPSQRGGIHVIS